MAKTVFLSDIQQWLHDGLAEYFVGDQIAYLDEFLAKYIAKKYFGLYGVPLDVEKMIH